MTRPAIKSIVLAVLLATGGGAAAETGGDDAKRLRLEQELQDLLTMRKEMAKQMQEFDRRIQSMESELHPRPTTATKAPKQAQVPQTAAAAKPAGEPKEAQAPTAAAAPVAAAPAKEKWGSYEPGKGFVLLRSDMGEVDFSVFSYARYLNQEGLDDTYTDFFGRTTALDLRNDLQFQKVTLNFKGWMFDPRLRYLFYTWTSNTSQGEPAQVVVAGNIGYQFSDAFSLYAGIGGLPSTRSTNYSFPNWLKNDHRTIADEYFRGSYTTGIWASGAIAPGLQYRAMLGNNLSQLGINANQLDDGLNTVSAAMWWMPTTGEYGPGNGFGDYEHHDDAATLFGVHYTYSREDAQGQSDVEGFENSQIRLSDGTRLFSTDPFGTGGDVRKATYKMLAANAGVKYRGWSLDGEAYYRWVDDFDTIGTIPVTSLKDYGFQVQGSTMFVPKTLQGYVAYSKIFGDYGNPWDFSAGVNWFPMKRKELRLEFQGLYLSDSPVGYSSVPFSVGGNGWVFSSDLVLAF